MLQFATMLFCAPLAVAPPDEANRARAGSGAGVRVRDRELIVAVDADVLSAVEINQRCGQVAGNSPRSVRQTSRTEV